MHIRREVADGLEVVQSLQGGAIVGNGRPLFFDQGRCFCLGVSWSIVRLSSGSMALRFFFRVKDRERSVAVVGCAAQVGVRIVFG